MSEEIQCHFAIIQFADLRETIEVIRTSWAEIDNNGEVIETVFPPTANKKYFREILKNNPNPDISWTNNGKAWPVKKTFRYIETLEEAEEKLDYYIHLTDVETDDERNRQALKKSRYKRAMKRISSSDSEEQELEEGNNNGELKSIPFMSGDEKQGKLAVQKSLKQESERTDCKLKLEFHPSIPIVKKEYLVDVIPFEQGSEENIHHLNMQVHPSTSVETKTFMADIPSKPARNDKENVKSPLDNKSNSAFKNDGNKSTGKRSYSDAFPDGAVVLENLNPFDKLVLTKINKIEVTTDIISRTIQTNGSNTVKDNLTYSFRYKDEDLKVFPLNDEQSLNKVEARLQSDIHFSEKVCTALKNVGKYNNSSLTVSALMGEVITFKFGNTFCFSSKNKAKNVFQITNLYKVVSKAAFLLLQSNESTKSIDRMISTWLSNCKIRDQRKLISEAEPIQMAKQ